MNEGYTLALKINNADQFTYLVTRENMYFRNEIRRAVIDYTDQENDCRYLLLKLTWNPSEFMNRVKSIINKKMKLATEDFRYVFLYSDCAEKAGTLSSLINTVSM